METVVEITLTVINEEVSSTISNEDEEDDFICNVTRFREGKIQFTEVQSTELDGDLAISQLEGCPD